MVIGAHVIIQSKNPKADLEFIRRLSLPSVSMGDGFVIHGLPPSEVAIHGSEKNDVHEFYLMCDDVEDTVAEFMAAGLACSPVQQRGWGALTMVTLPGGGKLGIYQPKHPRPKQHALQKKKARKTVARKKKSAKKAKSRKRARR